MKIEAGKSYRTRDGQKATVYAVNLRGDYCVAGCVHGPYQDTVETWQPDGSVSGCAFAGLDLIAPWTDTPTMDVTVLPRWATHVEYMVSGWWWGKFHGADIPPKYAPKETVPIGSRYRIDWDNKCLVEEGGDK